MHERTQSTVINKTTMEGPYVVCFQLCSYFLLHLKIFFSIRITPVFILQSNSSEESEVHPCQLCVLPDTPVGMKGSLELLRLEYWVRVVVH